MPENSSDYTPSSEKHSDDLSNKTFEGTSVEQRPFSFRDPGFSDIDGYTTVVVKDGVVTEFLGTGKENLRIGMKVKTIGNSRGYIPAEFEDGETAAVYGLREPKPEEGIEDDIVNIGNSDHRGWVKPSNVERADITRGGNIHSIITIPYEEIRLSPEEIIEIDKHYKPFNLFHITPEDIEEVNRNYRRRRTDSEGGEVDFIAIKEMIPIMSQNLLEKSIRHSFFEDTFEFAKIYKSRIEKVKDPHLDAYSALMHSKLAAIISLPSFISDERAIPIIEELTDIDTKELPPLWSSYKIEDPLGRTNALRRGINFNVIPTFEKIVNHPRIIHKGRNSADLLGKIAETTFYISEWDSSKTLPLRLKLLELYCNEDIDSYNSSFIHTTFKTEEDIEALKRLKQEQPNKNLEENINKILSGTYRRDRYS